MKHTTLNNVLMHLPNIIKHIVSESVTTLAKADHANNIRQKNIQNCG